jgi:hypothetical protein
MFMKSALVFLAVLALIASPAAGQTAKELKTKKGVPVALVNLLNVRPGCTSNPAPVAVPVVREKPANGTIQMLIVVTDLAAAGNCSARKVPAVALIYSPKEGFAGTDSVAIEIETGNRTTLLTYRISVMAPGDTL